MEDKLKKCYSMAKLRAKPLSIEKVINEVISKVLAVDTSNEEMFRISYNGYSVPDEYVDQEDIQIGNKKDRYFTIPIVVQKES